MIIGAFEVSTSFNCDTETLVAMHKWLDSGRVDQMCFLGFLTNCYVTSIRSERLTQGFYRVEIDLKCDQPDR